MSIAQKGQGSNPQRAQTWLPRFWRRAESIFTPGDVIPEESGTAVVDPNDSRAGELPDVASLPRVGELPKPVAPARDASANLPKPEIHPLASVDRRAILEDGVEIGPFCVVGPNVRIGAGTKLLNNVTILGHTIVGRDNVIFPNAVLGAIPQDKKFGGEESRLEVGDHNHIREAVTLHLGTAKGGGLTRVGSNNLLMVNSHLGHDGVIGDNCVIANNVMLAGHVHIGNNVVLSGAVGIHHFVTVGDFAYSGGAAKITHDVPPFVKVDEKDKIRGVNSVGLRRNGFREEDVAAVEQAIWRLFLDRDRPPMTVSLRNFRNGTYDDIASNPQVQRIVEFLERRNLGRHGRYLESLRAG